MIFAFNFPIQLPEFYSPEKGLEDALKLVIKGLKSGGSESSASKEVKAKKPAAKIKHNMNRDKFKNKDVNEEKEYCDTDTLK